jgi:putative ABC transport system ATP-binding protein
MIQEQSTEPIVKASGLVRNFGKDSMEVVAVKDVDLEVMPGEFLAITGRSGSGKTTLLNLLGGLDQPTKGTVLFKGQALSEMSEGKLTELRRHRISFIFQSFGLLLILSAYENIELPLRINGVPRAERHRLVQEALDLVGLGPRARHRPYELSGGEQQRIAIARSLVVRPSLILADEPTGELDAVTGMSVITLLKQVASEQGITVIVATHDLVLAGMSDRVKNMVDGAFHEASP